MSLSRAISAFITLCVVNHHTFIQMLIIGKYVSYLRIFSILNKSVYGSFIREYNLLTN